MSNYKVEFKNSEKIIYEREADIRPSFIVAEALECGGCACWCGTISFGYKIAKHTDCNRHINYIFKD